MTGLPCPQCQTPENSEVHNSRTTKRGRWRRRTCLTCGHRFTTIERVDTPVLAKLLELVDELE